MCSDRWKSWVAVCFSYFAQRESFVVGRWMMHNGREPDQPNLDGRLKIYFENHVGKAKGQESKAKQSKAKHQMNAFTQIIQRFILAREKKKDKRIRSCREMHITTPRPIPGSSTSRFRTVWRSAKKRPRSFRQDTADDPRRTSAGPDLRRRQRPTTILQIKSREGSLTRDGKAGMLARIRS